MRMVCAEIAMRSTRSAPSIAAIGPSSFGRRILASFGSPRR